MGKNIFKEIPLLLEIDPAANIFDDLHKYGLEFICEDEDGFVLVATNLEGLNAFKEKLAKFKSYNEKENRGSGRIAGVFFSTGADMEFMAKYPNDNKKLSHFKSENELFNILDCNKEDISKMLLDKITIGEVAQKYNVSYDNFYSWYRKHAKDIKLAVKQNKDKQHTRVCLNCGKTFIHRDNRQYCCVECYKKHRTKKNNFKLIYGLEYN